MASKVSLLGVHIAILHVVIECLLRLLVPHHMLLLLWLLGYRLIRLLTTWHHVHIRIKLLPRHTIVTSAHILHGHGLVMLMILGHHL